MLHPPWYAGYRREGIDRVLEGHAWIWSRKPSQSHVDWPALACEHLALLLACACLLGVFCCVQIVFATEIFISVLGWFHRVFRLPPAKAAVPLCAAYLLAAAFLAVRLNQPDPDFDLSTLLLAEVVLLLFTAAVYVGLALLFRWRQRAQESGAK